MDSTNNPTHQHASGDSEKKRPRHRGKKRIGRKRNRNNNTKKTHSTSESNKHREEKHRSISQRKKQNRIVGKLEYFKSEISNIKIKIKKIINGRQVHRLGFPTQIALADLNLELDRLEFIKSYAERFLENGDMTIRFHPRFGYAKLTRFKPAPADDNPTQKRGRHHREAKNPAPNYRSSGMEDLELEFDIFWDSDGGEEDHNSDEDYVKQQKPRPKKSKGRRPRRSKNELKKTYAGAVGYDSCSSDEEMDIDSNKYQWVHDLKKDEPSQSAFENETLVICRHMKKDMINQSLTCLKQKSENWFKSNTDEVILIKRSLHGQFYIVNGLHGSPHFSLGRDSVQVFRNLMNDKGVRVFDEKGLESCNNDGQSNADLGIPAGLYVKTSHIDPAKREPYEIGYQTKMKRMVEKIWSALLMTGTGDKQRSTNVINLGLTNRKVDCIERMSITGQCGLNLISTATASRVVEKVALEAIGDFLAFVQDHVLPTTPFGKHFETKHEEELKHIRRFGEQLGLQGEALARFMFPAISILINGKLLPHMDTMNPQDNQLDYTMAFSIVVPIAEVPDKFKSILLQKGYAGGVPVCLVVYRRRCLEALSKRFNHWEAFISEDTHKEEAVGRKAMLDLIREANGPADYAGKFWSKSKRDALSGEFKELEYPKSKSKSTIQMWGAKFPEAIDKMGFWSGLLHSFFLITFSRSIDLEKKLEIVLFFGHQCNGTTTIVHALTSIALGESKIRGSESWYTNLARACCFVKGTDFQSNKKDTGASPDNRFSPSSTALLSEVSIADIVSKMDSLFKNASNKMNDLKKDKMIGLKKEEKGILLEKQKLLAHHNLASELEKIIPGVGQVRSSHIIQFASLIGIIPLDYYVSLPMHCTGGPKTFMLEDMNWDQTKSRYEGTHDSVKLIDWTATIMDEMNTCFGNEWTCNMLETTSCIIGRRKESYDMHFHLPWIDERGMVPSQQQQSFRHQIEFRVVGDQRKKWKLVGFDGLKKHVFIGNDGKVNLEVGAKVYKS